MEQKAACEKSLGEQQALFREELERLRAVPGVGEIVALTAIAVFSDATRFPGAKHAASYAGLVPQTYQSGETNRQGHITRTGSPELRAMLVQAAHTARRPDSPLHPFLRDLGLQPLPSNGWMTLLLNAERKSSGYRLGRHPLK